MFDHLIRAFFRRHAILHPDANLIEAFYELMIEEKELQKWINDQKADFLMRVITRATEKNNIKTKVRPGKPAGDGPVQPPLPPKTMGGN